MNKDEEAAMNLLIHTLVNKVDQLGQGRELMDHLGPVESRRLMKSYDAHEAATRG
jgi:hypothetical protein